MRLAHAVQTPLPLDGFRQKKPGQQSLVLVHSVGLVQQPANGALHTWPEVQQTPLHRWPGHSQ